MFNKDYFEYIKKAAIRIPKIGKSHYCGQTVMHVIKLFTGEPYIGKCSYNDNLFVYNFFNQGINKKYKHKLVDMLFAQARVPEHLVFSILICEDISSGHIFVVEKKGNGKTTFWRIYQSFFMQYTLNQWLGNRVYKEKDADDVNKEIKKYGNGKKLNDEEIKKFLTNMIESYHKHESVTIKTHKPKLF